MMKHLSLYLTALLGSVMFVSCKSDSGESVTPPRDYAEQYATEATQIEEYLNTHYLSGSEFNWNIKKIPEGGSQTPLMQHPNLTYKMVAKHDIEYKFYYIKLNEGVNLRPSHVDSVFVSYKGWTFDGNQIDSASNPTWLTLDGVIEGWTQIFPELKTGVYNNITDAFEGSGEAIFFIPSGLGYYNISRPGIAAYSPLTFYARLNTLKYRDHDKDGIPSYLEVEHLGDDPRKYDSDSDGIPNYMDIDDDNDGYLTKGEILNPEGTAYPFDQIPSCTEGGPKRHLDPSCH